MDLNDLSGMAIDSGVKVHRHLGPGLLESAYETCLAFELRSRGLHVETQVPQPILYDGVTLEACYRLDLLVEDALVIELKTVDKLLPVHEAQLLSYLRLGNRHLGLLLNFRVPRLKDGIRRIVN